MSSQWKTERITALFDSWLHMPYKTEIYLAMSLLFSLFCSLRHPSKVTAPRAVRNKVFNSRCLSYVSVAVHVCCTSSNVSWLYCTKQQREMTKFYIFFLKHNSQFSVMFECSVMKMQTNFKERCSQPLLKLLNP